MIIGVDDVCAGCVCIAFCKFRDELKALETMINQNLNMQTRITSSSDKNADVMMRSTCRHFITKEKKGKKDD